MVSRKHITLLALLGLIVTASFAQKSDAGYAWVLDSSKRSVKNMPQQNEFMNNQYPYPSKPRSMWELGISGGGSFILGDVKSRFGYAGGLSFRKALSHVFSLRLGWQGGYSYGFDKGRLSSGGSSANFSSPAVFNPWRNVYTSQGKQFIYNYRTASHQLYIDGIVSLNAFSGYRGNPKVDYYLLAGYSYNSFDVDIDALNGTVPYNFTTSTTHSDLDGSYENNAVFTDANTRTTNRLKNNQLLHHAMDLGAGVSFRISDKVNIGLEQKFTLPFADELDGKAAGISRDAWAATQFRVNFNMGNSSKKVLPLWWLNGNNYIYNEVNEPKHMKMPPVVLPDADGDGVTDQFDLEPNTPSGSPVDSHGVSRDTDGDGVPDARDKEPLTARDCFPVDVDGIGKCPEPPCCTELRQKMEELSAAHQDCALGSFGPVQFKSGSHTLSATAKAQLADVARQLNENPNCNLRITFGKRALDWDRVNAIVKFLEEQQNISGSRCIWDLQKGITKSNSIDITGTMETGPTESYRPN